MDGDSVKEQKHENCPGNGDDDTNRIVCTKFNRSEAGGIRDKIGNEALEEAHKD